MEYRPGGYSWIGVAPEPEGEQEIERVEDQIHTLKKKPADINVEKEIKALEEKLAQLRKHQEK